MARAPQGFAELEYGILKWMGAIDDNTPVVTTIHDCQLLEETISPERMLEHDVPVDIIVTPTRVSVQEPRCTSTSKGFDNAERHIRSCKP